MENKTCNKMGSAVLQAAAKLDKHFSLIRDIHTLRRMRDEMVVKCGDTVKEYVEAVDRLIEYTVNPSDRELANLYLLIVGASGIALGVVCGAAGVFHAFHGRPEAGMIGLYASGFFAAGWICLRGVKK